MIKNFALLILAAGIIAAVLILGGTALIDRVSPVMASADLPALILRGQVASTDQPPAIPAIPTPIGATATLPAYPYPFPTETSTAVPTAVPTSTGVTIAHILADPQAWNDQTVVLTGMVTVMDGHEFLLNDGTGALFIEADSDANLGLVDGQTVTVSGKLEFYSASQTEVKAWQIYSAGVLIYDRSQNSGSDDDGSISTPGNDDSDDDGQITRTPEPGDDHGGDQLTHTPEPDDDHGGDSQTHTPEPGDDHGGDDDSDHETETPEPPHN